MIKAGEAFKRLKNLGEFRCSNRDRAAFLDANENNPKVWLPQRIVNGDTDDLDFFDAVPFYEFAFPLGMFAPDTGVRTNDPKLRKRWLGG